MTATRRGRGLAALLASALAVLPAGCGDEEPDLPTPVAAPTQTAGTPTPTSTVSGEEAEAIDEVLALFDGYLTTYVEFATSEEAPTSDRAFLAYAEADFVTEARNEVVQNFIDGNVFSGTLDWRLLQVVEVDLERTVDGETRPQVVVRICLDGSSWTLVERDTGETVVEPPGSFASTVTAEWREEREFGPDGWGLVAQDDDRSQTC